MPAKDRTKKRRAASTDRAKATVDALLDAAERILAERGLGAMSTAAIAKEAGLGKGTAYHYFASKEALAAQIGERMWRDLATRAATAFTMTTGTGFTKTTRAVIDAVFDFVESRRGLVGRWYESAPHLGSPKLSEPMAGELLDTFARAFELSPFAIENPKIAARVVIAAVIGMLFTIARDCPSDLDNPKFREETHRLALRYLTGRGAEEISAAAVPPPSSRRTRAR